MPVYGRSRIRQHNTPSFLLVVVFPEPEKLRRIGNVLSRFGNVAQRTKNELTGIQVRRTRIRVIPTRTQV